MGPWYYEVVSFDGDYVNLRRTDIESDELNPADKTKRRPFGRRFCIF